MSFKIAFSWLVVFFTMLGVTAYVLVFYWWLLSDVVILKLPNCGCVRVWFMAIGCRALHKSKIRSVV